MSWPDLPPPAPRPEDLSPAQFIGGKPVFRVAEVEAWYARTGRAVAAVPEMIRRHVSRGRYVLLRRGVYARTDFFDPFLIASRLAEDAVVGLISGLALRGLASSPFEATFLTRKRVAVVRYSACVFQPVRITAFRSRREIESVTRHGLELQTTRLERTFIDCLLRPRYAPEPEALIAAFASTSKTLDVDECIETALRMQSPLVVSRLAFAFSCTPIVLTAHQEGALTRFGLQRPDYFSRANRTQQDSVVSRWNIIVSPALHALRVRP